MIRAISHALPVTSNTPVIAAQALREQLDHLRARRDPPRGSHLAPLGDRDLTEVTVHIQPDRSHFAPFADITDDSGELWANDTDGSALAAQPGQSQGAATDFSGSNAHRRKRPAHVAFSRRPLEPSSRTVIPDPDGALGMQFHAPIQSFATDRAAYSHLAC